MKKNSLTISLMSVLIATVISVPKSYAQQYTWHPIASSDAIKTVQAFETNPNLAVTLDYVPNMNNSYPGTATIYSLTSGRYNYSVCAYASTSFYRGDNLFYNNKDQFYGQPYNANSFSQQEMSQSAAQSIAQAFMNAHFPAPQLLSIVKVTANIAVKGDNSEPDFIDTYSFKFIQDCGNGVEGPSRSEIDVDSVKGQIIAYSADYFPLLVSPVPSLSPNQAMASGMNGMHIQSGQPGAVDNLAVSFPDAFGNEQILYSMTFSGVGPAPGSTAIYDAVGIFYSAPTGQIIYSQNPESYIAIVDGNTGNVVVWSITLSGTNPNYDSPLYKRSINAIRQSMLVKHTLIKRLKFRWMEKTVSLSYPPIEAGKGSYAFAGYLCYGSHEAKLTFAPDKQIIISGINRRIHLHMGSTTYSFNGQTKRMSTEPILINDRCYVPLDVMQTVLGGKWSYDAKAQTVRYDPPQKKVARK